MKNKITKIILYCTALNFICFNATASTSILCQFPKKASSLCSGSVPIRFFCSKPFNGNRVGSNGRKVFNNDLDANDPLDLVHNIIIDELFAHRDSLQKEISFSEIKLSQRLDDQTRTVADQLERKIEIALKETYRTIAKQDLMEVVAIDSSFRAWLSALDLELEDDLSPIQRLTDSNVKKEKTDRATQSVWPPTTNSDDSRLMTADLLGYSFYTLAEFYRIFAKYVVVDLEATGESEHQRITDVACVIVDNWKITDSYFQRYVNPECKTTWMSRKITGYTDAFLSQFQPFDIIAPDLFAYIGRHPLVFHGGQLDLMLLNKQGKISPSIEDRQPIIDTEKFSRALFPNQKSNLNAACERLGIKTNDRTLHGALIDAKYTAELFYRMFKKNESKLPCCVQNWEYFPKINIYERFSDTKGTLGETYFQKKGIKDPLPPAIRFSSDLYHPIFQENYPAILIAFENNVTELQGVFVQYLNIKKQEGVKDRDEHEKLFYGWAEGSFANIVKGTSQKIIFYASIMNALMIKDILKSELRPTFCSYFNIHVNDDEHINIKAVLDDSLIIKTERYQSSAKVIYVIDKITSSRRQEIFEQYKKQFLFPQPLNILSTLERFSKLQDFHLIYKNSKGKIVSDFQDNQARTLLVKNDNGTEYTLIFDKKDFAVSINNMLEKNPDEILVFSPIVTNLYICELYISTDALSKVRHSKLEKYDIEHDNLLENEFSENIQFLECHLTQ